MITHSWNFKQAPQLKDKEVKLMGHSCCRLPANILALGECDTDTDTDTDTSF